MDTNAGRFVEEGRAEAWMQRIEVGEVVKIKGEELRVVSIGDRRITLELLSAEERLMAEFEGYLRELAGIYPGSRFADRVRALDAARDEESS